MYIISSTRLMSRLDMVLNKNSAQLEGAYRKPASLLETLPIGPNLAKLDVVQNLGVRTEGALLLRC